MRLRHLPSASVRRYHDGVLDLEKLKASVRGWTNHARYANTTGLRKAVLRSSRYAEIFRKRPQPTS